MPCGNGTTWRAPKKDDDRESTARICEEPKSRDNNTLIAAAIFRFIGSYEPIAIAFGLGLTMECPWVVWPKFDS
jgi:hypothetical protein